MIVRQSLADRLRAHSASGPNGCILWTGSVNFGGYGQIRRSIWEHGDRRLVGAHVAAWELVHGPVPPGKELDHLCRVRPCINVLHLEPVTHRENDLRGQSPAILRHHSGVCTEGHRITPGVQCRPCHNERQREGYRALRAAGYTREEAAQLRGTSAARQLAGFPDRRV